MIIANPIYDVVFKRLMENEKVAKFFIGTLLEENVVEVQLKPQEFTYIKNLDISDPKIKELIREDIIEHLSIHVFRLDFVATIQTETGEYKKVLIEIQKAKNQIDLMRFRNYLGEQYKKQDKIDGEEVVLPITAIYILGFNLPKIDSPCIKVERSYKDLISKTSIDATSDFIEKLSHDSFVVQVERITDRYQTRLDKLLSIFEQNNFVDDKEIVKEFSHHLDIDELKIITDILHHSGTSSEERKKIEVEIEALRTFDAITGGLRNKVRKYEQELQQKDQALSEKDQALSEKDRIIAELMKKINEQK